MIIPPVNTKGVFVFKEPFKTKLGENTVYRVVGIRTIHEMYESGEDPLKYVYNLNELTQEDFDKDLEDDVPIVTMTTNGLDFVYMPASFILSAPILSGHRYREYMIGIKLGLMPLDTVGEYSLENIKAEVRDAIGPDADVRILPSSAEILLDDVEDSTRRQLLENSKTVYKSWKTKYLELEALYTRQSAKLKILENELRKYFK